MTRVILNDLRTSGVGTCSVARAFCRDNGLSYADLKGDGIPVARLLECKNRPGDIAKVIEAAKKREAGDG